MLGNLFDWLQDMFGFRRGASFDGCGRGFLIMIAIIAQTCQVILTTNWFKLGF